MMSHKLYIKQKHPYIVDKVVLGAVPRRGNMQCHSVCVTLHVQRLRDAYHLIGRRLSRLKPNNVTVYLIETLRFLRFTYLPSVGPLATGCIIHAGFDKDGEWDFRVYRSTFKTMMSWIRIDNSYHISPDNTCVMANVYHTHALVSSQNGNFTSAGSRCITTTSDSIDSCRGKGGVITHHNPERGVPSSYEGSTGSYGSP